MPIIHRKFLNNDNNKNSITDTFYEINTEYEPVAAPASFHRGGGKGGPTKLVCGPTCAAINTQTWTPVKNLTNISQILCMISVC